MSVARFPPHFNDSNHRDRCLAQLRSKPVPLEKYIYLNGLKGRDSNLFYNILLGNLSELVPILYTPTVGEACVHYSDIWRRPEGLYVSIQDKGRIREVLSTWPDFYDGRIAVVTDGSRILGLGDLGANGLPISIGKLDLYIAGAGIKPNSTVPICLDLGTNTQRYLDDPLYIGVRRPRPSGEEMDEFMDEFMAAMKDVFPNLLIQFEDFSTDNAFKYLDRYRHQYRVFNDDIQGTGSVILSGFINAARLSSAASGRPLSDHRILFFGAGSAGTGVAKQLLSFFTTLGISPEEAKSRIYTVDSKGLITADRRGLQEHKKFFARTDYDGPQLTNLVDIINHVKPTALLGLSTLKNAFSEDVVKAMCALNERPIIFPLSNPSNLSELEYEDAIRWSDGKAIFASGSPYKPVTHNGVTCEPGQGNNMYIFPGIGLGSILSKTRHVSDGMVEQAAVALSSSLDADEQATQLVYPRLARIREISVKVAFAVIRQAQNENLDENHYLRTLPDADLLGLIQDKMWQPPTFHLWSAPHL
ncbi:malate dehydrogenase [Paxillus involutus ATCC 200175]|nr:malate dehydrogenase [Paxillus involutus ATCC 200175]